MDQPAEPQPIAAVPDPRFRSIVHSTGDGFLLCDAHGRLLDVNDAYCRMLGYAREELLRLTIPELEAVEDREAVAVHMARMMATGFDRFDTRHRHRSGHPVDLEASVTFVASEGAFFAFMRDITDRKKAAARDRAELARLDLLDRIAQQAPRTLRELLDLALDEALKLTQSAIGYIYHYDEALRQFTLHAWSDSVMKACSIPDPPRLYALERTGLWGEVVRQRRPILVNDFQAPHAHRKGYPEGHAPVLRFLTVPVLDDGRIVAVVGVGNKVAPYDDDDVERLSRFMASVWSIAQRLEAEESRQKLSALVESGTVAVALCDAAGLVEFANQVFLERAGLEAAAVLGRSLDTLGDAILPAPQRREAWAAASAGTVWRRQVERAGPGGPTWETVSLAPIRNRAGIITHLALRAEDSGEIHRLEASLRHAQRLESLGTLAGGVAHDFNNILAGMLGIVAGLREDLGDGHPLAQDIEELNGLVRRAGTLTRGLLAFGRRQASRTRPEELSEVVDGVARLVGRVIGEDVKLEVQPPGGRLVVEGDRGQLEQLLMNLLTNARDAMPGGGRIQVSLREVAVDEARARVEGVRAGRYAVLMVRDTGGGMSDEVRARIFDPFFTTKEPGKGTGLGLSIVYGIVKQHGGFVEVRSQPGRGTTFEVVLPLRPHGADAADAPARTRVARGHGETVLLAEDDPGVRSVWASVLQRHGYRVLTAEDGAAAVARFRAEAGRVDLALLDVTMPVLGGVPAADQLQALAPALPVLFASGYASEAAWASSGQSPRRLLAKPLEPAELLEAVRAALDEAAAAAPAPPPAQA